MGEALWTGLELLAFCLLVAGSALLWGCGWALIVAGSLLAVLVVSRAVAMRGAR